MAKGISYTTALAACKQKCRDDAHFPTETDENGETTLNTKQSFCRNYYPLYNTFQNRLGPKFKTFIDAKRNSAFFQKFSSPACPDQSKYDYSHDRSCVNYNKDSYLDGELKQRMFIGGGGGFKFEETDASGLIQALELYTRSPYSHKIIFTKRDKFYQKIDQSVKNEGVYTHLPVIGVQLSETNFFTEIVDGQPQDANVDGTYKVDLTGTILGYYAGSPDLFHDVFTLMRWVPLVEDVIKTLLQATAVVLIGTTGVLVAAGAIVVCGLVTVVNKLFGGDAGERCFDGGWDAVKDIFNAVPDFVDTIEEKNVISTNLSTTTFYRDNTAFHHFMNTPTDWTGFVNAAASSSNPLALTELLTPFFDFDDSDGWRPAEAFGLGGYAIGFAMEYFWIDQIVDVRIDFPTSKPALLNYQIMDPDDGMSQSLERTGFDGTGHPARNLFYFHRFGMLDYTFPPVDNLAYYWWHKWWQARAQDHKNNHTIAQHDTAVEKLGLIPLGAVLHAVQDITQPLHAKGLTLQGHQSYERDVNHRMDQVLHKLMHGGEAAHDGRDLILNLEDPDEEELFIERVIAELVDMHNKYVKPDGVLHIRSLIHDLYATSLAAGTLVPGGPPEDGFEYVALWLKTEIPEDYTRKVGLIRAIAATALILLEASSHDVETYQDKLDLKTFENFTHAGDFFKGPDGTYNRLETFKQPLEQSTLSVLDDPSQMPDDWKCAGSLPFAQEALEKYKNNELSGRKMLEAAFSAQIQCSIMNAGLPMPPAHMLDSLGKYQAQRIEAFVNLLSHGDTRKFNREVACAQLEQWQTKNNANPDPTKLPVPGNTYKRVQDQCNDTLDLDQDGILDKDDQCYTPIHLQKKVGKMVGPDGCLFTHKYKKGQLDTRPFVLGAYRIPKGAK